MTLGTAHRPGIEVARSTVCARAGEHLVEHGAEREEIAALIQRQAENLLR